METTDMQTRDIILRLKRVKAARGLSCGRICAMVAEAKVNKILLTIGAASTDDSKLLAAGLSVDEIAARLDKSRKAVLARLPYSKGQYGAEYPTINALRIRRSREKGGAADGEK